MWDFRANCMSVKLDEMIPDARKLWILTFDQMKTNHIISWTLIWKKYYEHSTEFHLVYFFPMYLFRNEKKIENKELNYDKQSLENVLTFSS